MEYYLQERYVNLLGIRLDNWIKNTGKANTFHCSCPYCGDYSSSAKKKLQRCTIYSNDGGESWWTNCFKCGEQAPLEKLLKDHFPDLYSDYNFEKFKDNPRKKKIWKKAEPIIPPTRKPRTGILGVLEPVSKLLPSDPIVSYLKQRSIPEGHYNLFYKLGRIDHIKDENRRKKLSLFNHRIIMPFYDKSKNLIALSGRDVSGKSKLRYVTFKVDKTAPLIYGLERIDISKPIFVTEGPIDSLFLDNALAASGAALNNVGKVVDINNCIFIFDNTPRAKEIMGIIEKIINANNKIVIWPSNIQEKDINEMVLAGYDVKSIIAHNTFKGIEAKIRFNNWRKK